MMVTVVDEQREAPVNVQRMERLARRAIRQLALRAAGTLSVAFIPTQRLRRLNHQFLRHNRRTDVLSFRYDDEPTVGEILIAPLEARVYATQHGIPYEEELARYMIHGLLHWLGHEDRTLREQREMRVREDALLKRCGVVTTA